MAFKYSTGFKNAVLDTGSVKGTFDGGLIKLYSAPTSVPTSADDALPGDSVLLNTYTVNDDGATGLTLDTAAADGVIEKTASESWQGTAVANGTAAFFRYEQSGDAGAASTTAQRIQGTVGSGGADMFLASTTITSGQLYNLDYFSLTFFGG